MNTIIFFSNCYPSETTIEKELEVLSMNYDKVYYIPKVIQKELPKKHPKYSNVYYIDLKANDSIYLTNYIKSFFFIIKIILSYGYNYKEKKQFIINFKLYILNLLDALKFSFALRKFITKNNLNNCIFYDYWFENFVLSLSILKSQKIISKVYCRAHGFDLYDERWGKNIHVPFRYFKIKYINRIYAISTNGCNYLKSKINPIYHDKIKVSFLGIGNSDITIVNKQSDEFVLVSASHTKSFKRVHLIPDLLYIVNKNIRWIHFGCGEMDEIIQEKIKKLPNNIKVEFRGKVENNEILKFYSSKYVDAFISLSIFEGIPVSMIECASFGIPIFACNVGGISDIVDNKIGLLINPDSDLDQIHEYFVNFINFDFDKNYIKSKTQIKFNYFKNYNELYREFK